MHLKISMILMFCTFFFGLATCSTKDKADPSQLAIEIAREYLMKNATESPVLYKEKYLPFYDFIAMDSAGGEIKNFTTMYDVDSLEKLCLRDKNSYCRQIVNTNHSIVFVPFYLFGKSKDDEKEPSIRIVIVNLERRCAHGGFVNYRKSGFASASYTVCRSPEMIREEKAAKVETYAIIVALCLGACFLLLVLTKKTIAFVKQFRRIRSLSPQNKMRPTEFISQKIKGFIKNKNGIFEKFIQLNEIKIKMSVTLLFTFFFMLSYFFYGSEHKQSIKNRYPLFCKSFQKENRACRINGVVLFTEMDPSNVPFLYLFVNGPDGTYEEHHLKYVDKNGDGVNILTYKEDYQWGMREPHPVRFWIEETSDSVKILYSPEPIDGFIVENIPFSKKFLLKKMEK